MKAAGPETRTLHRGIGTMGEKSLHAELKEWYARTGDGLEVQVDGFLVDIRRGRRLIEIQTGNFSALKRKLTELTRSRRLLLVYPIAVDKWIVRETADGRTRLGRRKSPKHGSVLDVFEELVSLPDLMAEPNFSLEILFVQTEEIRRDDGRGSRWRSGWSISDRRLIGVTGRRIFKEPADFLELVPADLPDPFTTKDLAQAADCPRWLAQKMAYCLRRMDIFEVRGKRGNAFLYSLPLARRAGAR